MTSSDAAPVIPIGEIRTFGTVGPKYEVGRPLRSLVDGDWMVEIVLVESTFTILRGAVIVKPDSRANVAKSIVAEVRDK